MKTTTWTQECNEWQAIKNEMLDAGGSPSAFDVSEEQRRRMTERGERALTLDEIYAQASARAS